MSANVENMFYVKEKPWHGLGTKVEEALCSADALKLAGLDWRVNQKPIQVIGEDLIPNFKANVRDIDNKVLGVVTDRYKIVQNTDAFEFTDALIGGDVRYETAGSLQEGRKIWLLAKMPEVEIAGDLTEPYLCFSNAHDGSGAIRICMTPIRVVCNNTLNLALSTAKRQWSTRHTGDIDSKIKEAKQCLQLANNYMTELAEYADKLANKPINRDEINDILNELFPIKDEDTDRKKNNVKQLKDEFMVCYFAPDIKQFQGTAWGVVNAMSDMITHNAPQRETTSFRENNWGRIMDGHTLLDSVVELVGVK